MVAITNSLNALLADYQVHVQRLRGYHWHVRGPHFFELHAQFETLYDEAALRVDALAERLLALGERPLATLAQSVEAAELEEDAETPTRNAQAMVTRIAQDIEHLNNKLRLASRKASEVADDATTNLLDEFADAQEKTAWMFRAFLGS